MDTHFDLSDAAFQEQFEACTLPPTLFTHEAHLRLAWLLLREYAQSTAEEKIQELLLAYVSALGAREKYNTTLTLAAMKAVHHFMQKSSANSFSNFIDDFPQLSTNFKDLMSAHYSRDIFNSEEAKAHYIEPDLLPFTEQLNE